MSETDYLYRTLPGVGKQVFRLGLAGSYGVETEAVDRALEEGPVNYLFWTPRMARVTPAVKRAVKRDRERLIIASGPTTAWWSSNLRRFVDRSLQTLDTDYLDVLQMHWLGVASTWKDSTVEQMIALREEGRVRALGVSIHNRRRAGELAADSPLDLLMVRYNAAHPGAEQDVFPHLAAERAIVAYTATSWQKLLRRPRGWTGEMPTAGHCYRFCLSHPLVSVVLTGPKNGNQLYDNLEAVQQGPLNHEEMSWMRELGKVVRG
jgi:aryl-alcohol dehydrogenase-like predicted oxidoreductase